MLIGVYVCEDYRCEVDFVAKWRC